MGDPPAARPGGTGTKDGKHRHRLKPGWRGVLASALTGAAGGMAVNDLSGTLGYRGLAGVFALAGVLAATNWLRKLDARAWLPRYASWLFLTPAAAFNPGPSAGILTAVAVILTTGGALLSTGIEAAANLLLGVAFIGGGMALIGVGVAWLADRQLLLGVALIGAGVACIGVGVAWLADRQLFLGAACIGGGMAFIGVGVARLADRQLLLGVALIGGGMALIGGGATIIGPSAITSVVRQLYDLATKAPGTHDDQEAPSRTLGDQPQV